MKKRKKNLFQARTLCPGLGGRSTTTTPFFSFSSHCSSLGEGEVCGGDSTTTISFLFPSRSLIVSNNLVEKKIDFEKNIPRLETRMVSSSCWLLLSVPAVDGLPVCWQWLAYCQPLVEVIVIK